MNILKRLPYLLLVFSILLIQGCSESSTEPEPQLSEEVRGGIISTTSIYTYSKENVQYLLNTAQVLGSFDITYFICNTE